MTSTSIHLAGIRHWSSGRQFAAISAAVYLLAGIVGFAVTGFDAPFTGLADTKVVILAINPLHNVIHLTLGAGYLLGVVSDRSSRYVNISIGAGLLGAFALGVFGGAEFINIAGVSEPDNWLHLVWGSASVWFGTKAGHRLRA